jgi:hypothetical protein
MTFPMSKNTRTLHGARFEYFEQLYRLGRPQIHNSIHDINFGIDSSLNFLFVLKGSNLAGKIWENLQNSILTWPSQL